MRLGLVGWASDTGLGMELRDAMGNLPVASMFILQHPGRPASKDIKFTKPAFVSQGWDVTKEMFDWLAETKLDTVLTWETPGDWRFPAIWHDRGVRWVCVMHWDWFSPEKRQGYAHADLISPNMQCRDGLKGIHGLDSTLLPVPVDLERLPFKARRYAHRFVSVYGQGGPFDRRSIKEMVEAWRRIPMAPPLTIHAQKEPKEDFGLLPPCVSIEVGNVASAEDLYAENDIAVLPSKFEGVGLSLVEAQALGLPVITTDMEPMRTLAPELLVECSMFTVEYMKEHRIPAAYPSVDALVKVVDSLHGKDITTLSHDARRRVETEYSWTVLKDRWMQFLSA